MTVDEQLEAARQRRSDQLDDLVNAYIAICMTDYRIDDLLSQMYEQRAAEQPGRMV